MSERTFLHHEAIAQLNQSRKPVFQTVILLQKREMKTC